MTDTDELEIYGLAGIGGDTIRGYEGTNHILRLMLAPTGPVVNIAVDDLQLATIRSKCDELLRNSIDAGIALTELGMIIDEDRDSPA